MQSTAPTCSSRTPRSACGSSPSSRSSSRRRRPPPRHGRPPKRACRCPTPADSGETYVVETAYGPVTLPPIVRRSRPGRAWLRHRRTRTARRCSRRPSRRMPRRRPGRVWLSRVDRLALATLALALVVAATLVVLERQARRQPRARAAATALTPSRSSGWRGWRRRLAVARRRGRRRRHRCGRARSTPPLARRLRRDRPRPAGQRDAAGRSGARAILARRGPRHADDHGFGDVVFGVALQVLAGLVADRRCTSASSPSCRRPSARSAASLLRFSVAPWETLRLARLAGLVLVQAAACWAGRARLPAGAGSLARPGRRGALADAGRLGAAGDRAGPGPRGDGQCPAGIAPGPAAVFSLAVAATAWLTRRGIPWFRHGSQASRLGWLLVALLLPAWLLYPVLVDVVDRVKTRLVEQDYAEQVRKHPDDLNDILKRAAEPDRRRRGPATLVAAAAARTRRAVDRAGLHRLAQHRAGRGPPDVGDRAVRRRRGPGQPLRAELPRGGSRAAAPSAVGLPWAPGRRGAAVRRRRAADAARRARPVRGRRQGRPARSSAPSSPT